MLPALLFAAGSRSVTATSASQCQEIVAAERASDASLVQSRLGAVARARIANVCASSGVLVVESLWRRSHDEPYPALAAYGGT